MTSNALMQIQTGLKTLGHAPGPIDGEWGPQTRAATLAMVAAFDAPKVATTDLPWMIEAKAVLGRHEVRDNGWLRKWLGLDGRTLGDPAKLPWCGDFVETCIRLALSIESFHGPLKTNPYWARNWTLFGRAVTPCYGAVLVFERGTGGHVGFAVGQDDTAYHVIGGNQSNAVTVARVAKARLLSSRWPETYKFPAKFTLPRMTLGGKLSTNEA